MGQLDPEFETVGALLRRASQGYANLAENNAVRCAGADRQMDGFVRFVVYADGVLLVGIPKFTAVVMFMLTVTCWIEGDSYISSIMMPTLC